MDTNKVTRVEIINHYSHKGREYSIGPQSGLNVELSVQDDGRTLKVFIDKRETHKGRVNIIRYCLVVYLVTTGALLLLWLLWLVTLML